MLFYENELFQLFDTYFHAVYEAPTLDGYIDPNIIKNPHWIKRVDRLPTTKLIESPHKDSEPYSEKQRDMIIEYFSKVALISKEPPKD